MDLVFATETRQLHLPTGSPVLVRKGTHWPAEDPLVRRFPDTFSADARYGLFYSVEPPDYDAPIEVATAAPGEKRSTQRPTDDVEELRRRAVALGVQIDMRWGPARLRQEIENA